MAQQEEELQQGSFFEPDSGSAGIQEKKEQLSPMRKMLATLKDRGVLSGDKEWENNWDEDTLGGLRRALQIKDPSEVIPSSLDEAILEKAATAFKQFAPYIPLLYLANQADFEANLSEIFCEAVQTTEDAQMSFVQVLLDMLDYRTTQYFLNRFISRNSPELEQVSTFRKAVIDWCTRSEEKVHYKKALFPIDAAVSARRVEIAQVKKVAEVKKPRGKQHPNAEKPRYPDDDLVKIVKQVCRTSKPLAYSFLGLAINSSGAFDDVRQELIDINNLRKSGDLKAHKNIAFTNAELSVLVKVLMIAHDKLHRALETSQVNLNKSHCDKLNEEIKKNRGYEKTIRELTKHLDFALADVAKISGLQSEIKQLKEDLMQIAAQNEALRKKLSEEIALKERAQTRVKELNSENSELSGQLKEEKARSQRAEGENESLRHELLAERAEKESLRKELLAERAEKERVEDELRALREQIAVSKPDRQHTKKDSYQVGGAQVFFGRPQSVVEGEDLEELLASLQAEVLEGDSEQAKTVLKPGYGSPEDQSE